MKEVKSPKKPLIYYYGIVLLFILVFNMVCFYCYCLNAQTPSGI